MASVSETPSKAMVPAEEEEANVNAVCEKCRLPMTIEETAAPKAPHSRPCCKSCHALFAMLGKQLSVSAVQQQMPGDDMVAFCRKVHAQRKETNGPLRYQAVRNLMKNQIAERIAVTYTRSADGTYQPLSWWKANGYDEKKVEEQGEKQEHAVFGTCYRVDLLSVSTKWSHEQSETEVLEMEAAVKRKRTLKEEAEAKAPKKGKTKGKGKGKNVVPVEEDPPTAEALEADAALEGLSDMETEDCVIVACTTARSSSTASERATLRKALRQEQAQAAKDSKMISAMAGKGLPTLRPIREKVLKLVAELKPHEADLPSVTNELVKTAETDVNTYHDELVSAMKKISAGQNVPLSEISFSSEKDMASKLKAFGDTIKAMQAAKKTLQPQKS